VKFGTCSEILRENQKKKVVNSMIFFSFFSKISPLMKY
jgi:hypothetical protein